MVEYHIYLSDAQERVLQRYAITHDIPLSKLISLIVHKKVASIKKIHNIHSSTPTSSCYISGCTEPILARGLCSAHYQRWRRYHLSKKGSAKLADDDDSNKDIHKGGATS